MSLHDMSSPSSWSRSARPSRFALASLCDASPIVFVDHDGSMPPLRVRRERTSQKGVCCGVLGTLYGLAEAHLRSAGHWQGAIGGWWTVFAGSSSSFMLRLAGAGQHLVTGDLALWVKVDGASAMRFGHEA